MTQLSPHFKRAEFASRCGDPAYDTVDAELLAVLEDVRTHFGRPVIINSGCRSPAHNKAVKGATRSQHLYGRAADFTVRGVPPSEVAAYLERKYPGRYGIGRYRTFTHIDTRTGSPWRGNQG